MTKDNLRLIAFDMDGTVLQSDGEITVRLQKIIKKAMELGIYVVPCSGRGYMQIPATVRELRVPYTITSNGGLIWDENQDRRLYADLIPWEMAAQMYRDITDLGGLACFHIDRGVYYEEADRELLEQRYSFSRLAVMHAVRDGEGLIRERREGIEKIFVRIEDPQIRQQICENILDRYPVFCSSSSMKNLEFSMPGCTKGKALRWLCDHLQVDSSQVVAFGDGENAKEMLTFAGLGLAAAAAGEVCRAAADGVIGSCEEDGVAVWLEALLGSEGSNDDEVVVIKLY